MTARDESTYSSVARKYDDWVETESSRPARDYLRRVDSTFIAPQEASEMSRTVQAAIGIGIAVLLLILAALAFRTAAFWGNLGRDGAATGYTLVAFFLCVAGFGGIAATWNHNFRVLTRTGGSSHH